MKQSHRRRDILPDERADVLRRAQNEKMASSAHAFVRGSTIEFYKWLDQNSIRKLPVGPPVWICGDCHNGNLGPVAGADGSVSVQVRDLDQTVIGNPAHDLIRLGLSVASAVRGSDLPGVTTACMLEEMVVGYETAFTDPNSPVVAELARPDAVRFVMRKAATRSWKHLARERLENSKPTIPLGSRFWPITEVERSNLQSLFVKDHIQRLATMLRSRPNDAVVEFIDAAYWMKGCSSLGKLRYAVLLSVTGEKSSNPEYCLMDVKEAVKPVALRATHSRIPKEQSERVVSGARHVSPSLGDRMRAGQLAGHSVFIRELLPQDLKIEMERLTRSETMKAAHYLAAVIGKAHARQMDATTRASWLADLAKHRSKVLDAPSWLWTSVIELLVTHERSYLEHCRRYALQKDAS